MKLFKAMILSFLVYGCSKPIDQIELLSGYWEIEKVVLQDGTTKTFTFSETIDYFQLNDSLKGLRAKVMPMADGKFSMESPMEDFKVVLELDSLNVYYKTPYAKWKETIKSLNSEQLVIVNQHNNVYFYKRYKPITLP